MLLFLAPRIDTSSSMGKALFHCCPKGRLLDLWDNSPKKDALWSLLDDSASKGEGYNDGDDLIDEITTR